MTPGGADRLKDLHRRAFGDETDGKLRKKSQGSPFVAIPTGQRRPVGTLGHSALDPLGPEAPNLHSLSNGFQRFRL